MKLKVINLDNNEVFDILRKVDIFNQYGKSEEFKSLCVSHENSHFGQSKSKKTVYSATHYMNKFYKAKNLIINTLIKDRSDLINEWHYEFRNDECFLLISFLVNGQMFRFHQVADKIATKWLDDDKRVENRVYSHDSDMAVHYDTSSVKDMREIYDYLIGLTEKTERVNKDCRKCVFCSNKCADGFQGIISCTANDGKTIKHFANYANSCNNYRCHDCRSCAFATLLDGKLNGWVSCSRFWGIDIMHSPSYAYTMCSEFRYKDDGEV